MNSKVIVESGSNYVKFGNGLLIQWGWIKKGLHPGWTTITYRKPFSNPPVITLGADYSSNNESYSNSYWRNSTSTSFQAGGWNSIGMCWISIGN